MNIQHTNLKIIKNIAIQFVYTKPEHIEDSDFCKDSYISNCIIIFLDTNEPFNIFQDIEKYHMWQEEFVENIGHKKLFVQFIV